MPDAATERFTVGVFQDAASAAKGIDALRRGGFLPASLSIVATSRPDVAGLIAELGVPVHTLDVKGLGSAATAGPLIEALGADLARLGLAGTMRHVGFQTHDARIFEALTAKGGVLVAVRDEPRAADALATLFSYGGGNAAIGAWTGRV
jgi:hypothetical protein